jgi:hypothetical protein
MDHPQYGPQIWTLKMDPKYGPPNNLRRQNHGESMGMPLVRWGKLEINCRPKSGYYACNLSARLTGKAARQGCRARLLGKAAR